MNPANTWIGIDLGGTQIKTGLVDGEGIVRHFRTVPTEAGKGRDHLLAKLHHIIEESHSLAENSGLMLRGTGIGTAGFVDADGHVAYATEHLPGWTGTRLKDVIEEQTRLPAAVLNDVHAIAQGELWKGAASGTPSFVCVAIGTGIGGCIVENNRVAGGSDGFAGGFGHQIVAMNGLPCSCGNAGCWETYASVTGLKHLIHELSGNESWVASPKLVFDEARSGEVSALNIVELFAERIAVGLTNLAHTLNVRDFLLAGAVMAQGGFLLGRISGHMNRMVMPVYWGEGIRLHAASLGEQAGVIGAAAAVMKPL